MSNFSILLVAFWGAPVIILFLYQWLYWVETGGFDSLNRYKVWRQQEIKRQILSYYVAALAFCIAFGVWL